MLFDSKGVSEVIGYIAILAITVSAIGITYAVTVPDLQNGQSSAQMQNMEQGFTVMDVRVSKAQYSGSVSQMTEFNLNNGIMRVNDSYDNSHIIIKRRDDTEVYNGTLGTIYYTIGDREVAYQGGGIWGKYGDSGSVMISAPDFNYNGETLTLPIMRFSGNKSVSGNGKAFLTASSESAPVIMFPNETLSNGTNPVVGENVYIIIKSDYYKAWATFANQRTFCAATTDDSTKTTTITFNVKPTGTKKPLRPPITVRNINTSNPEPVKDFYFNMSGVGSDFQMDFRSPASNSATGADYSTLHITFQKASGLGTSGVRVIVEYSNNGKVESFQADKIDVIHGTLADLDLLDDDILTEYTSNDDSWTWGHNNKTFDSGDYVKHMNGPTLNDVIQHYMLQMAKESPTGTFSLWRGNDGGQHWPDVPPSTYVLDYDAINVLTYLHVTDNEIKINLV